MMSYLFFRTRVDNFEQCLYFFFVFYSNWSRAGYTEESVLNRASKDNLFKKKGAQQRLIIGNIITTVQCIFLLKRIRSQQSLCYHAKSVLSGQRLMCTADAQQAKKVA